MTDLVLNFVILGLGFVTAVTAALGDTWTPGPEFILKRLTKIGWLTVGLAVAVLAVGSWLLVRSHAADAEAESRATLAEERTEKLLTDLNTKTSEVSAKTAELDVLKKLLEELSAKLDGLRTAVDQAQKDPAHASAAIAHIASERNVIHSMVLGAQKKVFGLKVVATENVATARSAIESVIKTPGAVQLRYQVQRRAGKAPFDAVLDALSADPSAQAAVRTYGKARTEEYVTQLEKNR